MSVRFLDANQQKLVSKETQTAPVHSHSVGTDPPKGPEQATQTEPTLVWNLGAAKLLRIDASVVDGLLEELERCGEEWPLFEAYEQSRRGGRPRERLALRVVKQVELAKLDTTPTQAVTAIRCGPGGRVAILLGEPQHEAWCTEHSGQLLLVHRRQTHAIPLPACPSELLFARYGELLIVGLHSGELLFISGSISNPGETLWSSGASTLHSRAITKLVLSPGKENLLFSVGLDGKVLKCRIEPNNRLEPIATVQIALSDLPRNLRKANTAARNIGIVDLSFTQQGQLFIATETGALLELEPDRLEVKEALALGECDGLEQFALFGPDQLLVWRTSDGRVHQGLLQTSTIAEKQLIPIGRSKQKEFSLLTSLPMPLLFVLSDLSSESGRRGQSQVELLAWDLSAGELVLRQEARFGDQQLEAICLDPKAADLLVAVTSGNQKEKQLIFYEISRE